MTHISERQHLFGTLVSNTIEWYGKGAMISVALRDPDMLRYQAAEMHLMGGYLSCSGNAVSGSVGSKCTRASGILGICVGGDGFGGVSSEMRVRVGGVQPVKPAHSSFGRQSLILRIERWDISCFRIPLPNKSRKNISGRGSACIKPAHLPEIRESPPNVFTNPEGFCRVKMHESQRHPG